jgi:hypothetical protein
MHRGHRKRMCVLATTLRTHQEVDVNGGIFADAI